MITDCMKITYIQKNDIWGLKTKFRFGIMVTGLTDRCKEEGYDGKEDIYI